MLFSRKAMGMEISQSGASFTLVGGTPETPKLLAHEIVEFPADTLRISHREPNVTNPSAFVARIREASLRLLGKTSRVSVSLPDSVGRVMLIDLETRLKNREEGFDIIRWKLKKNFPFDINEVHLDYQVLKTRDTGEITALVSLVSRQVVTQYEELILEAGLEPTKIDFTSFNLYRLFENRLKLAEDSLVVEFIAGTITILIFNQGILEFYRTKDAPDHVIEPNRAFMELNSSILVYRDKYPGHAFTEVFCIAPPEDGATLCSIVAEATGLSPVSLETGSVVKVDAAGMDRKSLYRLAASLGAAVRNL